MPSSPDFIDFVCSQLAAVGTVRARKMMGDYVIYVDEKCVILACDGQCFVKKIPEIAHLMGEAECGFPYDGAREHYILDVDHRQHAERVVAILRDTLPYPKRRSRQKAKKPTAPVPPADLSAEAPSSTDLSITRERLKGAYSEGEALAIYQIVKASGDFASFARRFIHDEDYQVARNTLWGLTKATNAELARLQPLLDELIDLAMAHDNSSVRRLTLNVIERLSITEANLRTDFLDFCLTHMTVEGGFPGIQSLSMKLAYRMSSFYPELKAEFIRTIEAMEPSYYSPAVTSVRRRILQGKM